jgi:hypothetical protein
VLRRLAVTILTAGVLSGCVCSDYDISQQLRPTFPIAIGQYASKDSPTTLTITRFQDSYLMVDPSDTRRSYTRFSRAPEFDNYIVQSWHDPKVGNSDYFYNYASVAGDSFTIADCCEYAALPQYLQNLVQQGAKGIVIVLDGPRDTLYLIREIGRRGLKLSDDVTYTHK